MKMSFHQMAQLNQTRRGEGDFVVKRVGTTVEKPKKYQAMHLADPKKSPSVKTAKNTKKH